MVLSALHAADIACGRATADRNRLEDRIEEGVLSVEPTGETVALRHFALGERFQEPVLRNVVEVEPAEVQQRLRTGRVEVQARSRCIAVVTHASGVEIARPLGISVSHVGAELQVVGGVPFAAAGDLPDVGAAGCLARVGRELDVAIGSRFDDVGAFVEREVRIISSKQRAAVGVSQIAVLVVVVLVIEALDVKRQAAAWLPLPRR